MDKLKVMHIIWNMNDGGAQKVIMNYLNDLSDDSDIVLKVFVYKEPIASICNKEIKEKFSKNVKYLNNPHTKFKIPYFNRFINKSIGKKAWIKEIKLFKPDIVHVHISEYLTTVLTPIVINDVPVRFDTLHSNPYRNKRKTLKLIRRAFQKERFIPICVTDEQVEQAMTHYGIDKYEVLHNGIDFEKIRKESVKKEIARKMLGLNNDDFVVLGVGRLSKIKKFDLLIKAFSKLYENKSNAVLLIAGDGEEREKLYKIVSKCDITDSVKFIGNRDDMPLIYSAADVLAVTSESESSSIVLLEAQALGLRCVISDGVPSESIYTSRVQRMSKNSTIIEWANALGNIDYKGQIFASEEDYDVHKISKQLKEIYLRRWKEYEEKSK